MIKRALIVLDGLDASGVAFAAQNLIAGLDKIDVTVLAAARRSGTRAAEIAELADRVVLSKWLGLPLLGRAALRELRAWKPEIVHAQSLSVAGAAARLARGLGVPLAVTANRLDCAEDGFWRAHTEAGAIAVSAPVQERLSNRAGVSRDRISVIPNGLDLRDFPRPAFLPAEHRHVPVVGCYGTLAEDKGQRVLLQAAAEILKRGGDVEFLIIGEGPDKTALRRLASELGIASRVTFSPNTVARSQNLLNLDLFVEPTRQEGLGLSVMQAMASGVPVIASGVGGIFSLIDDGKSGVLVPSGNAGALAEAVMALLADPARRLELAREARDKIEREFDVLRVAPRVAVFYKRLAEMQAELST